MDKRNKKQNVISFTKNFYSCYTKAEEYFENGEYIDALQEANNAYSMDCNADIFLLLAEIYTELNCHTLALHCACQALSCGKLDSLKKERLIFLLPKVLLEDGYVHAALFFMLKTAPEIKEAIAKVIPPNQTIQNIIDKEMQSFFGGDKETEENPKFISTDELREKYNEDTVERALGLMAQKDFEGARYLLNSLYETNSETYKDGRRFLAFTYFDEGRTDKAVEIISEEYNKDKSDSQWIYTLSDLEMESDSLVKQMICEFEPSEEKRQTLNVLKIAFEKCYDEEALIVSEKLLTVFPGDPSCRLINAFAKWNITNTAEAKNEVLKATYSARAYYPAKYIAKLRFPKRINLDFDDFPFDLIEDLFHMVIKELKNYEDIEDYSELLTAFLFIIRNNRDVCISQEMLRMAENIGGQFLIDLYKRVIVSPGMYIELQKSALEKLIDKCRKGKIYFNNEGFLHLLTIRVPPSYDDFSEKLKTEYCQCFSQLAEFDDGFEKNISEIFEKIYLKDMLKEFPKNAVIGEIVAFYVMHKKNPSSALRMCEALDIRATVCRTHSYILRDLLRQE